MTTLVQLVPRLPPAVDGLGDYAALLGDGLTAMGITTRYVVGDPAWDPAGCRHRATVVDARSATALATALADADQVLLHFVNYAYEPTRGCPGWLIDGLERWHRSGGRRLLVMFHELYAMAWPWRKAFWYSPAQRAWSARLARLADGCWTSNRRYGAWLERMLGRAVPCWPVLSNIGEPEHPPEWNSRRPALVVFGRAVNRRRAYDLLRDDLWAFCRLHHLRELHDVGAPMAQPPPAIPGMSATAHGLLPPDELSRLLLTARFGLIHNDGAPLAKSGVVAAYAAHGLAILSDGGDPASDGLVCGHNLVDLGRPSEVTDLSAIADHAHRWYRSHARPPLVAAVAQWLAGDGFPAPRAPASGHLSPQPALARH
jgi:hypothetical protein